LRVLSAILRYSISEGGCMLSLPTCGDISSVLSLNSLAIS